MAYHLDHSEVIFTIEKGSSLVYTPKTEVESQDGF